MGYEGYSKPLPLTKMNPIVGNRGEFLLIFLGMALLPMLIKGRRKNEEGMREEIKTTNRYAKF